MHASCSAPQQSNRRCGDAPVDPIHCIDELGNLNGAVMRRDIAIRVPEENLARLFAHARGV